MPAELAELADALDSGSSEATRAGSTPVGRSVGENVRDPTRKRRVAFFFASMTLRARADDMGRL